VVSVIYKKKFQFVGMHENVIGFLSLKTDFTNFHLL
jgi:hypothetical protein